MGIKNQDIGGFLILLLFLLQTPKTYLVLKLVGILVLFLVEVNEVVSDSFLGFGIHLP